MFESSSKLYNFVFFWFMSRSIFCVGPSANLDNGLVGSHEPALVSLRGQFKVTSIDQDGEDFTKNLLRSRYESQNNEPLEPKPQK